MQPLAQRLAATSHLPWPDAPISISLVITDLDVGGAERVLTTIALRVDCRRWKLSVIALAGEGKLAEPLREAGIDTECLGVNPRRPLHAVAKLAGALRHRKPQLIQSFMFHANVASRLAARWAGRPWVVGGLRVAEKEKSWHLTLDSLTMPLSSGSVCVSEGVLRFSRDIGRIDPRKLVVIPNCIDPAPYDMARPIARADQGIADGGHLALFVGRLEAQKAPDVLLDAAEIVARVIPDWQLAIVGDGPYQASLQERIRSSPLLSRCVHWLGRRDDVPSLLKTADVLVLPSLWEGMPNVVLEAMAAGRAVVATAVEGSEDLVRPGESGWLVPPGSAKDLAEALLEAARDPERTTRFGTEGRKRVEAHFTIERMVEAYESLWAQVLGRKLELKRLDSHP